MDFGIFFASVFLASTVAVIFSRFFRGEGDVRSQFLVTGTLLFIFYMVSIVSGVCTIINFLFRLIF